MSQKIAPTSSISITRDDLPGVYLASSDVSGKNQNNYINLIAINLILLTVSALISSVNIDIGWIKDWLSYLGSALLVIAIIVTVIIDRSNPDKYWYGGRAIAESVKTISWKYITKTDPYGSNKSQSKVDALFLKHLSKIIEEKKYLTAKFGKIFSTRDQISEKMKSIRLANIVIRRDVYIESRIKNQQNWYADNSEKNNKQSEKYTNFTYAFEALSLISMLILYKFSGLRFNPVGLLTTIATSLIAWQQLKQFGTLSESYGLAARELGNIAELGKSVRTNSQLSKFVSDAENAISREHTMWVARRQNF